jgi:hypothetical protein
MNVSEFSPDGKEILAKIEINGDRFYGSLNVERSVMIPGWIISNPNLSDRAVRLWGYLKGALSGSFNIPGTSHTILAEVLDVSNSSIRRSIYELRDVGALQIVPRHKNGKQVRNDYYLWPARHEDRVLSGEHPRVLTGGQPAQERTGVYISNNNKDIYKALAPESSIPKEKKKRVKQTYPDEFATIWSAFPRRSGVNKGKAFEEFNRTIQENRGSFEDMLRATQNYALDRKGQPEFYTLHPSTFFGAGERWKAYLIDCEDVVTEMTSEMKLCAEIYDSYDQSSIWINPTTGETMLDNPMKHGYTRPTNHDGKLIDKDGNPYKLNNLGVRERIGG